LESLKRVVIVEDILKSKSILSVSDQSPDVLLTELSKLRPKIPSIEVLQATKLGKVLNRLTKHADQRVARSAMSLVNSWKADIRERRTRKPLDVRCDARTTRFRKDAKRLLQESLSGKNGAFDLDHVTNIAEEIEREIFSVCDKKANEQYRKTSRKVVFSLRHRSDLRMQVLERKIDSSVIVRQV